MGLGVAGTTFTVQIDLSGTPFGAGPTWTDVTGYLLTDTPGSPIEIGWGRTDDLSDVPANSCSFTLDNRDGRFTPGLTSSPYYPHVKRRVRCRVSCVVAATTVYLFDGLIDSWETSYTSGGLFSLTTVSATDMLGRLGTEKPLRPIGYEEVLLDGPASFYPLNDQGPTFGDLLNAGAVLTATPGFTGLGINYQNVTIAPNTGGPDLLSFYSVVDPDVTGAGLQGYFSYIACNAMALPTTFTLHFVTSDTTAVPALVTDTLHNAVGIKTNGFVSTSATGPDIAGPVNDGKVYQLGLQGGTIWVDGLDTGFAHGLTNIDTLGFNLIGTLFAVAFFNWLVPSAQLVEHWWALGGTPTVNNPPSPPHLVPPCFAGESTSTHIARLLSYRPNFGSALDVGVGHVGVHSVDGVTLQQALYDTAEAEGGVVFADGQGRVVFRNRSHMFSPPTTLTLDAAQGQVEASIVYRDDGTGVVNGMSVTNAYGSTQRYFDSASQIADGVAEQDITLIVNSDAAALAAAKWRVQVGIQERIAASQLDVNLLTVPSETAVKGVLQLQPLDVVAITGMTAPVPSTETFMVQGGTLTIGVEEFTASLFTTVVPAGAPY